MVEDLSRKSRYKPNLDEFISQCELNYSLILRLMPFLRVKSNSVLECPKSNQNIGGFSLGDTAAKASVEITSKNEHSIDFELLEKAKYTTTLMLKLKAISQSSRSDMSILVRLYHDAKLLEVMDKVGPKALKPIIKGEHLVHKQVDEKRQLNRFLGESLRFCLNE